MLLVGFLILFPLIAAVLLALVRSESARKPIVYGSAALIAIASCVLVARYLAAGYVPFEFSSQALDWVCLAVGIAIAAVILSFAVRYKNVLAGVLAVVQVVGSIIFDLGFAHHVEVQYGLYLDSLTLLMVLVIGIVGSGICVYALGYMEDFQDHEPEDAADRRPFFFMLMFLFLGAMYLIVFSNNMSWLFTGWEITTLCSFLLIGYTRTEEAINNAFRQIIMNLLGGIAFLVAMFACALVFNTLSLDEFLMQGQAIPMLAMLPVCCLAFAGITKAAQMPFHTWLLGAMVAPTPTSALLHSSTMVKAGVFLLVKIAPLLAVSIVPQTMVILTGSITFLLCSCMAISQTNAKRVLAYSTIANLGLITACAGVGTPEAVWAACFLILFHAIAKSLLFLCVGTAEHHIGSRNIEDMDLLFERMPRLARYMMLGIMVMFIAPFGMLISKWATLMSFAETGNVVLIMLLAFGSAATFMFWAKWLGKLAGIAGDPENVETTVHGSEWIATTLMAVLAVVCCVAIPVISNALVEPYLAQAFGMSAQAIADDNLWIAAVCCLFLLIVMFGGTGNTKARKVDIYLAGVNVDNTNRMYRNALSGETQATARNMYLENIFGERLISPAGSALCGAIMVVAILVSLMFLLLFV